jgi:hypothetical protein
VQWAGGAKPDPLVATAGIGIDDVGEVPYPVRKAWEGTARRRGFTVSSAI